MTKCAKCQKPLKLIGIDRKNGIGNYYDWQNRFYHKKCWGDIVRMKLIMDKYKSL